MDGLTPKKLDPNKMLTQEAKEKFFPEGEIFTHYSSSQFGCNEKIKGEKCHHSKTYSWQENI